jgi:hypothetical protein
VGPCWTLIGRQWAESGIAGQIKTAGTVAVEVVAVAKDTITIGAAMIISDDAIFSFDRPTVAMINARSVSAARVVGDRAADDERSALQYSKSTSLASSGIAGERAVDDCQISIIIVDRAPFYRGCIAVKRTGFNSQCSMI